MLALPLAFDQLHLIYLLLGFIRDMNALLVNGLVGEHQVAFGELSLLNAGPVGDILKSFL